MLHYFFKQILFAWKVVVETSCVKPNCFRKAAHGHSRKALIGDQLARRVHDLLTDGICAGRMGGANGGIHVQVDPCCWGDSCLAQFGSRKNRAKASVFCAEIRLLLVYCCTVFYTSENVLG